MAIPSYARRFAFASNTDELTAEEAGFYATDQRFAPWGAGRRVVLIWTRAWGDAAPEDVAQISFEFVNWTAGVPDDTWTDADFVTVEGYLDTWWTAVKPQVSSTHTLSQYRWYEFGPRLPLSDKGNEMPGPPRRITARSSAGTMVTQVLPPQVAMSVTFKTALRRHWGRIYVPGPCLTSESAPGRIAGATRTAIAGATDALFDSCSGADFSPMVYSPTKRRAYSIEAVQMDDVFDVIRRRRMKTTTARTIYNT